MAVRSSYETSCEPVIIERKGVPKHLVQNTRTSFIDAIDVLWHVLGAAFALYVFRWHFTEQATRLPGARGFGWFFKFLTFWGWTLQTVQYTFTAMFLCVPRKTKYWPTLARIADDISCVAFTVAMTVFLQFWMLHWVTGGMVERSQDRPPWLGFVMHVVNGILAVSDVLISNPRTFSRRSHIMLFSFAGVYGTFLAACRYMNEKYPYPFMNQVDPVLVYFAMLIMSMAVMHCISLGGRAWAWTCGRILIKADLLEDAPSTISHTNGKRSNGKTSKQS